MLPQEICKVSPSHLLSEPQHRPLGPVQLYIMAMAVAVAMMMSMLVVVVVVVAVVMASTQREEDVRLARSKSGGRCGALDRDSEK